MAKYKKTKTTKTQNPFKQQKMKNSKQDIIALILALAAVCFFILNAIYFLTEKDFLIGVLTETNPEMIPLFQQLSVLLPIVWILFAILMSLAIYQIENKKQKWYSLLMISIISLFVLRIDSFILGVIASILYIKNHK